MGKINTLLVILFFTSSLMAQTPQSLKYQAVARDASGEVLVNQQVCFQISILQGSASGSAVYTETHTDSTNYFGLVTLEIGTGTTTDDFSAIDWSYNEYFIQIEMDATGGTSYFLMGISQLLSVPYALHAKTAANTFSGNYSDLTGAPITVSSFSNDAGYLTSISEIDPVYSSSEAVNISSTDITNLANLSGINTGDQNLRNLAAQSALEDTATNIRADIPDVSGFAQTANIPTNISELANDAGFITDYTVTETDVTKYQLALSITENQISDLTHFTNTDETDQVYAVSVASEITATDTTNWNNKLDAEIDGDLTNELQDLSYSNNTLSIDNGNSVIINESQWIKTGSNIYIDNGNVGIGTASPGEKLEVNGKVKIGEYSLPETDGTIGQVLTTDGSNSVSWESPAGIPIGGIIMYYGSFADIPANWKLCDGNNGTPNLSDRFVMGTTTEGSIGDMGGSADAIVVSHTHTADHEHNASSGNAGEHIHSFNLPVDDWFSSYGSESKEAIDDDWSAPFDSYNTNSAGDHSHTITVDNANVTTSLTGIDGTDKNLPPFYKLAFIIRTF